MPTVTKKNKYQVLKEFYNKTDDKKLNIAIFSDCYYPLIGGITTRVHNNALSFMKYANVFVATGKAGKYNDDVPYPVIRCKGIKVSKYQGNLAFPMLDCRFKKLIKELKIDVIHLHTYFPMSKSAYYFSKKLGIPVILIGHCRLYPEYLTITKNKTIAKLLTKHTLRVYNKADFMWTVSQNCLDFYRKSGLTRDVKIDPSASDRIYPLNAQELIDNVNKKYNLKNEGNYLICLSRMEMKQKNLGFMLNSLKIAKAKGFNFKLLMVGRGADKEKLKKYASEIGISDTIVFFDFVESDVLTGLLLRSDLHLFPSLNDNFGLTKVEAATLMTPTLAIAGTAVSEHMQDGVNGFICEPDENAFADKIISIFSDRSKLEEVSKNAQRTLGKTWDDIAPITIEETKKSVELYNKTKNKAV